MWVEYGAGGRELYDLVADPDEMRSLDDDPDRSGLRTTLADRLDALRVCRGASCRNP